jgi:GWxTD domain-containing protein
MKKILALSLLLISAGAFAASAPRSLGAYLSHATFNIPGNSPYLETYLEIIGNTIVYKQNAGGKFQGSVQVTMIIRQDSVIKDYRKYELLSPELDDTTAIALNFIDQQRFMLENGSYELDLSIADLNVGQKPVVITYPVVVSFPDDRISVSGIQLVNSFSKTTASNVLSKSGYDFVPYVDNFYPSDRNKLTFYAEIYNPAHKEGSTEKYLVSAFIESYENNRMLNEYVRIKREDSKPVIVLLSEFDISRLPSGNYNLVVSIRNKNNEVVGENIAFFQRFNPSVNASALNFENIDLNNTFAQRISSIDTLREFIRTLSPIATEMERIFINSQINAATLPTLQQFFYRFWSLRDELEPEKAWIAYNQEVIKVNNTYSTQVRKGYETDMGRVYLQYGPPNTITDVPFETSGYRYTNNDINSTGTIPYQIWHYYSINNNRERNKRFVFINSSLRVTDYQLVHSDVRGEIQNYNWQRMLTRSLEIQDRDADDLRRDKSRSARIYEQGW